MAISVNKKTILKKWVHGVAKSGEGLIVCTIFHLRFDTHDSPGAVLWKWGIYRFVLVHVCFDHMLYFRFLSFDKSQPVGIFTNFIYYLTAILTELQNDRKKNGKLGRKYRCSTNIFSKIQIWSGQMKQLYNFYIYVIMLKFMIMS